MASVLPRTLKFKIGFYLAVTLSAAMALFSYLVISHERELLLQEAVSHATYISAVVTKSTRYAMLQNQPDYVLKIIQDVSKQEHIAKVRLLSKEGRIIHSTFMPEIGQIVDRKADGCILCHQGEKPLEQLARSERSRIYTTPEGRRVLGSMEVIRNERSCYSAACHQHSKAQSVLGVLDIVYSLDDIDRTLRKSTITIAASSLAFVLLVSAFVALFVHRMVYVPLSDLEGGAKRLSSGNLEQLIPVRSPDEFGQLAASFNAMTTALRNSRLELQEWGRTLEQKVAKRTLELRAAEAETARGEKLASVGLLAAGIAHELNNPLTGILTFSSLLRQGVPDGSPDAEDLDLVIRETRRCATIIKRLLDFARERTPEKKFTDVNRLVVETARIIERPANLRDIEIAMDLEPGLPPVWADADQITQVIMNMLVNAQHAIEEKGSITVRSRRALKMPVPGGGGEPVPMVELSFIDTGCGIPEKNLKRIFDPFFTSKEVGKGTGLGLSVSHGIVSAHGGTIEVESRAGEGTTFRILLPQERPPERAQGASGGGDE